MNLLLKTKRLLNTKPSKTNVSSTIKEVLNPYKSKEYDLLKTYVHDLVEIEKNIKKFDGLRISGDPKDLEDLVKFTFQALVPKEFLTNYNQFRKILMNTPFPPIDLRPYRKVAYEILINLFKNFTNTVFTTTSKNGIIPMLNDFIAQLNKQNIERIPSCKNFLKFANDLTTVCQELGEEGNTWLDSTNFAVNEEYNQFLEEVENLFGTEISQQLLDTTAFYFENLKKKLVEFNNILIGQEHKTNEEDLPISHGIFLMKNALAKICKEPYLQEPKHYKLVTEIPEGKMIYWDDDLVQYAYEIGKKFEQFALTAIKEFPKSMREGVMLLAKANLCSVIENTIAKAQSFVEAPNALTDELTSEEILQKQVVELKGVAPKFISLLKIMREDKVSFVFSNLRTILNKIGFSLLSHVDNLLDNQKPYSPQNLTFTYWDGEIGASYKAYSASDDDELKMYLTLQKKTISRIAIEFAEPIVQLLKSDVVFDQNFGNHGQLTKWIRIVDGVKAFQTRDPTNPISTMERFIIKTLNSYNLDNITTEIPQHSIKGESNEYFSNLIKQIKRNIMAKAEILLRQRNIKRYNALLDFYNKHLANKYPFANYDNTKRSSVDADLDTVKQFFVMYDEFGGSPEKILDQIYQLGPEADDMFKFLQKVHVLRQFLGGSIMSTGDIPKIKLSIDFGINKKNEINTGYLVDRIFKPNHDSSIEFISEDKSGLWYFGESVQIVFRWAEGDENAEKPSLDSDDPDKLIDNTKAIVECVGDWSILRFLQKYKAKDASVDKLSNNQNLLCFEIPLTNNKKSKVYVAITAALPSIPGETSVTTLAIPSPIGDIPKMSQQVVAVSNTPVLVDRISSGNADISIEPVESISEEEESTTASSQEKKHITQTTGKKKATTKSAQTTTKSGSKPKNEKEKAMEILESSNSTSSNNEEEKVAEITEEIIE